jgi:hypothetical protein
MYHLVKEYKEELQNELAKLAHDEDVYHTDYKVSRIKTLSQRLDIKMLSMPLKDVAVGDFVMDYGTVISAVVVANEEDQIHLRFKNGKELFDRKESELMVDQGGTINRATY